MNHDIEDLLQTLDVALMSDSPVVKKALKKFLFIVKMTEHEANGPGPYETLLAELRRINNRLDRLEASSITTNPWASGTYPFSGNTWIGTSTSSAIAGGSAGTHTIKSTDQPDYYKYIKTMITMGETDDK